MNNYNCVIIADSVNTFGNRITTFKLTYPRIVHSELMTHRLFSRNAASSRAVPVSKMIESVRNNMFIPLGFQKSHKGMQGTKYLEGEELDNAVKLWIESAELAISQAEKMKEAGITKQLINRILEPYQYYQVLVTATEWDNFFKLRCPQYYFEPSNKFFYSKKDFVSEWNDTFEVGIDTYKKSSVDSWSIERWNINFNKSQADIHIQSIAELMWDAYNESQPKQLRPGQWHIPYDDDLTDVGLGGNMSVQSLRFQLESILNRKIKISTARCARLSYETLGDNPKIDYDADINLHDRLISDGHMSPLEHVARSMTMEEYKQYFISDNKENWEYGWCRNLKGWISYRKLVEEGSDIHITHIF
jgi:thymidylate synthase ThyX